MQSPCSMPHRVTWPARDFRTSLQPQHLQYAYNRSWQMYLFKADSGIDLSSWLKFLLMWVTHPHTCKSITEHAHSWVYLQNSSEYRHSVKEAEDPQRKMHSWQTFMTPFPGLSPGKKTGKPSAEAKQEAMRAFPRKGTRKKSKWNKLVSLRRCWES